MQVVARAYCWTWIKASWTYVASLVLGMCGVMYISFREVLEGFVVSRSVGYSLGGLMIE